LKKRALQALTKKHHGKHDFRLNLITLALRGKKANFVKVVKMVEDMAALLKKEQASDSRKKAYCEKNVDETEDEFKELQQDVKDLDKAIADHKENIKSVGAELESLSKGIVDLDKEVAAATKNRRDDNTEYKQSMSSDLAATELLEMAKNRLAKFYTPKMAKAALLQNEERATISIEGPSAAPASTGVTAAFAQYEDEVQDEASIGFLQVRSGSRGAARAAPPPPPEVAGAYKKSGEQSNGVMAMLDILIQDLKKGVTENETNEKLAQKEYEEFIADAADKRAGNARSISDKEGNKVELEANSLKLQGDRKGKMAESMAKMEAIQGLHSECDWLVKNYDVRKQARASEIENLSSAKAVLSGADS
jgi:flagellar motility protein MotE (MotC chaperone)